MNLIKSIIWGRLKDTLGRFKLELELVYLMVLNEI